MAPAIGQLIQGECDERHSQSLAVRNSISRPSQQAVSRFALQLSISLVLDDYREFHGTQLTIDSHAGSVVFCRIGPRESDGQTRRIGPKRSNHEPGPCRRYCLGYSARL